MFRRRTFRRVFPSSLPPYLIEHLEPRMLLTAYVWNNAAGGSWNVGTNWTPNGIPGATANDTATIDLPGTYTVTLSGTARSIDSLTLGAASGTQTLAMSTGLTLALASSVGPNGVFSQSGGTLDGAGDLTVASIFNWTGSSSTMSGIGKTIIAASGTLSIPSGGSLILSRILQNDGTTNWTGGTVSPNAGTFNNNGAFNVTAAPFALSWQGSNGSVFNNSGSFIKTGSAIVQFVSGAGVETFNNSGTVDVQDGTLVLTSFAATSTHTGDFTIAAGATLNLSVISGAHSLAATSDITGPGNLTSSGITHAGSVNIAGTASFTDAASANFNGSFAAGSLNIAGGTANFNTVGAVTIGSAAVSSISGGTLGGNADVIFNGTLNWSGGTMSGSAKTIISNTVTLNIPSGTPTLSRILQNDGTTNWTAGGPTPNGGTFINNGNFIATASTFLAWQGSNGSVFNNNGTLTKDGTADIHFGNVFNSTFNNSGTVNVIAGALILASAGTDVGDFAVSAGATLNFSDTRNLSGSSDITGLGNLTVQRPFADAGTVDIGGTFNNSGTSTFTGTFSAPTLSLLGGTTTFNTTTPVSAVTGTLAGILDGSATVTFTGTLNWSGGTMSGTGKTIIASGASIVVTAVATHTLSRVLEIAGTMTLDGVAMSFNNGTLNNLATGVISNVVGIGSFPDLQATGGTNLFSNAGTLNKSTTITMSVNVPFNNTGTVNVDAGTLLLGTAGSTNSGIFDVDTGSTLRFSAGYTHNAGSNLVGLGIVIFESGAHTFPAGTFNPTGTLNFYLGTITINNPITAATVNTSEATVTINAPQNITDFTLSGGTFGGTGDLTVTGTLDWSGGTMTGGAMTEIAVGADLNVLGTGSRIANRRLEINGGATLDSGGGLVVRVNSVAVAPGAVMNMANNAVIVDYTAKDGDPLAEIKGYVTSGYNNGAWNGLGINSSAAATTPNRAIGYAESSALFSTFPANFMGQQVDNTAILIRYTRYGDADLSGNVNLNDFNRLAANFGQLNTVWSQGNFNYDDRTNLNDFNLLAANFGQTASPLSRGSGDLTPIRDSMFDADEDGEMA